MRILVIEDEVEVRNKIVTILRKLNEGKEDFEISAPNSQLDCYADIQHGVPFDLIFLDDWLINWNRYNLDSPLRRGIDVLNRVEVENKGASFDIVCLSPRQSFFSDVLPQFDHKVLNSNPIDKFGGSNELTEVIKSLLSESSIEPYVEIDRDCRKV